jgi:hypothetical protein
MTTVNNQNSQNTNNNGNVGNNIFQKAMRDNSEDIKEMRTSISNNSAAINDLRESINNLSKVIKEKPNATKWFWVVTVICVISFGLAVTSFFIGVTPYVNWNVEAASLSITLTFVGILATFVVVNNHMEIRAIKADSENKIQTRIDSAIKEYDYNVQACIYQQCCISILGGNTVLGGISKGLEYLMLAIGEINKAEKKAMNADLLANITTFFPIMKKELEKATIAISDKDKREYTSILDRSWHDDCKKFREVIQNLTTTK